jgi:hypothetical protein
MPQKIKYTFQARVWRHGGKGGWCFISMPVEMATEIREHLKGEEEGWGRMKATAMIGTTQWDTAIWFDTKHNTYLLPIKADVRKKEKILVDAIVDVAVWI